MEAITLRQIEFALAVEKAGAICAAAQVLHVAQPSVSQQILALEREVGAQLFERTPSGSPPTAAGQIFLDEVRDTLGTIQRARSASLNPLQVGAKRLVVAVEQIGIMGRVAAALQQISKSFPQLSLQVREVSGARDSLKAVSAGAADIAVGAPPTNWHEADVYVGVDEYVVIFPSGHRLAGKKLVEVAALHGEHLIETPATAALLQRLSARSRISPALLSQATSFETALRLARSGVGIALIPENAVAPEQTELISRTSPRILRTVHAFHRGPTDDVKELFVSTLMAANRCEPEPADWVF
ncbi:LysR family transcriptional regulator [Parafrigoribacterium mesophilum]|uniref:LysR family transcriptional regulator n=1 Tax=Parafrigoribacterium mesophilum TaxID=433646 RepID=UPI0031FBD6E6